MTPFRSESLPSVADTSCCEYGENLTGRVPDWISSAIRLASDVVTPVISLPLMLASMPPVNDRLTLGVATSWLSTMIASSRSRPAPTPSFAILAVMSWKSRAPPFL